MRHSDSLAASREDIILPCPKCPSSSGENLGLILESQEGLLVMSWNDLSLGGSLELLETLSATEPSWMVTSKPALGDTIAPLLRISITSCSNSALNLHSQ